MPRPPRSIVSGQIYHVVNRGNDKRTLFSQPADYEKFVDFLDRGRSRAAVKLFGYCLMPTHFHLLAQPQDDTALSAYMHWVSGSYACDLRVATMTVGHGHVFQRRYWSCLVPDDSYFLTALRYIEANPLEAGLAGRAEQWAWSSFCERQSGTLRLLSTPPVPLPANWESWVHLKQDAGIAAKIMRAVCPSR